MEDGVVSELKREDNAADGQLDWHSLRVQSTRPYGFGAERVKIWPRLLHIGDRIAGDYSATDSVTASSTNQQDTGNEGEEGNVQEEEPHADERQIGLDTDRSFVLYPVEESTPRETLQAELNRLIVSVFRRRPRLHYFQGYHDIVSVFFLTLPKELHFPVTEKVSLHRVRDSMGTTLEPVVGLLRILQRILHLADEKYAAILEWASPLPYYALSNLLTLFSHDIPTLPLIQHIFDYLLSRPPIAVVYLAAALTLTRRQEVQLLEDEGEEGMMHSLLTGLPELYEEGEQTPIEESSVAPQEPPASAPKDEEPDPGIPQSANADTKTGTTDAQTDGIGNYAGDGEASADASPNEVEAATQDHTTELLVPQAKESSEFDEPHERKVEAEPDADPAREGRSQGTDDAPHLKVKEEPAGDPAIDEKASLPRTTTASPDPLDNIRPQRPRVSLTALLTQADELYELHPPTHPGVNVASIMGPQSVMLTWSERPSELPDDDEAELMVTKPELVVLPYVELDDGIASDEASSYHSPHRKGHRGEKESEKARRRKKLRKPHRLTDIVVQRRTMVAGAVLVLGVAMAVYGLNGGLPGSGSGHHRSGFGKEWRKVGRFLGGALVGAGERVMEGLRGVH
ncbi:rab-GTPase-TBC domain-containing protein [Cubamyces lactineus]|nr:rab-GTPase-TBC domain-containing protein [Cubamyces lactineus]